METSVDLVYKKHSALFQNGNAACGKLKKSQGTRGLLGDIERHTSYGSVMHELKLGFTLGQG